MEINNSDKSLDLKKSFVKNNITEQIFELVPNPLNASLNKDKAYYGTLRFITMVTPQQTGPPIVTQGVTVVFAKFQKLILDCDNLYSKLKLFKESDTPVEYEKATKTYLRTFADATRLGLLMQIQFTLVPTVIDKIYLPFGLSYKTTIPIPMTFTLDNLASVLMANIFVFDGNYYEVKPGSIKQKKSKKTTNTFG